MAWCTWCFGARYKEESHVPLKELPQVLLDSNKLGTDCVLVKNGKRVCGTGAVLANAPIAQNKAYFEVKVQCGGIWGVGLATDRCQLDVVPQGQDTNTWVLRSDGTVCHNNEVLHRIDPAPVESDIVGCSYDHVELNIFVNGKSIQFPITGIRGRVYPLFYVDDAAILDVIFTDFIYPAPEGFEQIMFEQNIL
ncbi:SPRY domain-containing protein 7-like [Corticium candelabrum]|uniref:SPRY domain-containing protein 7-like n=1 Tax=Corticium candelabrum TaxID=121492 RepID=UPI002E259469|nr:SPRY domain-containing protein 7-like [Corticium candelabrum]